MASTAVLGDGSGAALSKEMESACTVSSKAYCDGKPSDSRPPERFSDPSTIVPPSTLQELISRLHEIFADDNVSVEYVQALMASYRSNRSEWKRYAKFDPYRYTRNLVDEGNGKFNLMVLCWNEGQGSSIHSHANSHCFLKVLSGGIKENMYEWPEEDAACSEFDEDRIEAKGGADGADGKAEPRTTMRQLDENLFPQDACAYINDSLGLHRVENNSHTEKAITLHLYSPPFQQCQCFDERTGKASTSSMTFWSKYGKRTPFGRDPEKVLAEEASEKS